MGKSIAEISDSQTPMVLMFCATLYIHDNNKIHSQVCEYAGFNIPIKHTFQLL